MRHMKTNTKYRFSSLNHKTQEASNSAIIHFFQTETKRGEKRKKERGYMRHEPQLSSSIACSALALANADNLVFNFLFPT